jgi:hypothetical protein
MFIVIKANGSETKTNYVVGMGRYLLATVLRPRIIEILFRKEKHEVTFSTLQDNLMSNKMPINASTIKPDVFFRFTGARKAAVLPTPVKIEQWHHQPRANCRRCNRDIQPTLAQILNGYVGTMMEMIRRYNNIFGAIEDEWKSTSRRNDCRRLATTQLFEKNAYDKSCEA